jgi:hypothetical protein
VKVEGKDNKRILHTIAKVVPSPVEPFPKDWEQTIHNLRTAPRNEDRCWVILIRGLEVRLIEYHRAHEPGVRMIPCDFMIEGRSSETVHIRTNDTEVNSILTRLPLQWPEPLSEIELTCLAVQLKATKIKSNETESFLSDTSLKSSKPTLSDGLKVKTTIGVKPTADSQAVLEVKAASKAETFTHDEASAEMQDLAKNSTEEPGSTGWSNKKPNVVAQDTFALQDKAAAPIVIRAHSTGTSQLKPTSQTRIDPKDPLTREKLMARLKSIKEEQTKDNFKKAVKAKIDAEEAAAAANMTKSAAQDEAPAQSSAATTTKTSPQPKAAPGNVSSQPDRFSQAKKLAQLKSKAAMRTKVMTQAKPTAQNENTPSGAIPFKSKSGNDA